jgi:hypothetical protein
VIEQLALAELAKSPATTRTNYYRQTLPPGSTFVQSDATLLIFAPEAGFQRLYYVTRSLADLQTILSRAGVPVELIVASVQKEAEPDLTAVFSAAGFAPYAVYQRMRAAQMRMPAVSSRPSFATDAEVTEIHALLVRHFDAYTDHLPTGEELRRREMLVRRNGDRVCGFIVFVIEHGVCNFNYLYNASENPPELMLLLRDFYTVLRERGIQRGFLWVDTRKNAVIRLHERFGWKLDGLHTSYYRRRE